MLTTAVLIGMLLCSSASGSDAVQKLDDRPAQEAVQENPGPWIERFPLDIPWAKENPRDLIALRDRTTLRGIIIFDEDGRLTICTGTEIVTVKRADVMAIVRKH